MRPSSGVGVGGNPGRGAEWASRVAVEWGGIPEVLRLKGAKGAVPGSARPALHAEPLTSLRAGDTAPFPASEAPTRAPAPGPST